MLRIALCDDDVGQLEELRALVERYFSQHPQLDAEVFAFASPQALLDRVLVEGAFQVCILDVLMPSQDGISLGTELRKRDGDTILIYLTTSPDYAVESYRIRAFHYLLKPVEPQLLFQALDEATRWMRESSAASIVLKTRDGLLRFPMRSILYAELAHRYVQYHLEDGSVVKGAALRGSFRAAVAPLLADRRFALCGASFVINLQHVRTVERGEAVFAGGQRVPISRPLLGEVKAQWMDYWLEGGQAAPPPAGSHPTEETP